MYGLNLKQRMKMNTAQLKVALEMAKETRNGLGMAYGRGDHNITDRDFEIADRRIRNAAQAWWDSLPQQSVFLAISGENYEGEDILGIFTTLEAAVECAKKVKPSERWGDDDSDALKPGKWVQAKEMSWKLDWQERHVTRFFARNGEDGADYIKVIEQKLNS